MAIVCRKMGRTGMFAKQNKQTQKKSRVLYEWGIKVFNDLKIEEALSNTRYSHA